MASTVYPSSLLSSFNLHNGRIEGTFNGSRYSIRYRTRDTLIDRCALKLFREKYVKFDNPNDNRSKIYVFLPDVEREVKQQAKSKGIYHTVLETDLKGLKEELLGLAKGNTVEKFIEEALPILKEECRETWVVDHMYQAILRSDFINKDRHDQREKRHILEMLTRAYIDAKAYNEVRNFNFEFKGSSDPYQNFFVTPEGDLYRSERGVYRWKIDRLDAHSTYQSSVLVCERRKSIELMPLEDYYPSMKQLLTSPESIEKYTPPEVYARTLPPEILASLKGRFAL